MAEYGGAMSLSQARDCHTSEDEDEEHSPRSGAAVMVGGGGGGGGMSNSKHHNNNNINKSGVDVVGSEVEVVRKPRGRPPGSKNKPKPPIVITRDNETAMRPIVLELSAGSDLVEMVSHFARRRHVGLSVLSGSGTVANVTLRLPVSHASTLILHGSYHILSLSGTFLGSSSSSSSSPPPFTFTVSLSGAQGQVFGGTVAGSLIAASTVVIVAASFLNPSFHRLPNPNEEEETEDVKPTNLVGGGGGSDTTTTTSMSMSVYGVAAPSFLNSQIHLDALPWPPTSRSPHY